MGSQAYRLLLELHEHCKEQGRCNMYLHGIDDSIAVIRDGKLDNIIRRDNKKIKGK